MDSIPNRDGGVVVSQIVVHRQGYPSGAVSSIPAHLVRVADDGLTIHPAQVAVNSVVAVTIIVGSVIDELCIDEPVVTVVAEHHVIPEAVDQGHISQVDDVVGIAVNLVTVVVEVVKRCIKERSEGEAQDAVDDRSSSVGVPSSRDHGAIPYEGSGTIGTCGRGQGATPTPQVVGIVVVEVVVVVVSGVVIVVVGAVSMISSVSVAVTVSTMSVAVTIATVSITVIAVSAMSVSIGPAVSVAVVTVTVVAIAAVGLATRGHVAAAIT